MTITTSKNHPLEDFRKVITPEACSQLASLFIAHYLVLQTIEEAKASFKDPSTLKEFQGLMSQISPLAIVAAFLDPSTSPDLFTSKDFHKFTTEAPDLYALCQTPEAKRLSATDIYNELCYGVGHVAALAYSALEEFNKEIAGTDSTTTSSSGLVN